MHSTAPWRYHKESGSQLVELAIALPLLLVLILAIIDFGGAFNLKQKINNAAREGARFAAQESLPSNSANPTSDASAVAGVVNTYLQNAGLKQCTVNTAPGGSAPNYTFTAGGTGCTSFSMALNRSTTYTFTNSGNTVGVSSTKLTITYPYSWTLSSFIKVLVPSSTLNLPSTISTDATMENLNP